MERRLAVILAADMAAYSRHMEKDEDATLARLKKHRHDIIEPGIAKHGGRVIKTTGDGFLADFGAAQEAVRSAIDIQCEVAESESKRDPDERVLYRMGINLGDVIFDEADVFGDGVNIASRLESIAAPGGICLADAVHHAVADRLRESFRDLGSQKVKNISRPIRVWQWSPEIKNEGLDATELERQQRVRFAAASDGVQVAWASIGKGIPVLKAPNWMNHLEYEWRSPVWGPMFREFSRFTRFVRFDQRSTGLSDWEVPEVSLDLMIKDMVAVADAAEMKRFALFGISQGAAFSIHFADLYPQRVSCLVLLGGYLRGRLKRQNTEQVALYEGLRNLIRDGWGSPNPVFRHFFTSNFLPDAAPEAAASFDELQRVAVSPENALRLWDMNAQVDVVDIAKRLNVPTLVLHCVGDRIAPIAEGRFMAKSIPGAHFVELPGNDHALLDGSAAFNLFFEETKAFLAKYGA